MLFRYHIRDRKSGHVVERGQTVEAKNRTEARKILAECWRRDVPLQARNYGFVPFRDCLIIWEDAI